MTVVVDKYRRGYRFRCPISKSFYGPFFKSEDAIQSFHGWYDNDVRYIGTWVTEFKKWSDLIFEWQQNEGYRYRGQVCESDTKIVLKTLEIT